MSSDTHNNQIVEPDEFASTLENDGTIARYYCLSSIVISNLFSFRLQHILTLLTMAIGSLALSATLFVGEGALSELWQDLDKLMGNRVIVYADPGPHRILLKKRPTSDITTADFDYIKKKLSNAKYVAPRYFGNEYIAYKKNGIYMTVDGITQELHAELSFQPIQGTVFSEAAKKGLVWECMITESAAKYFSISLDKKPSILIGQRRFQVIGIIPDPPDTDKRFQKRVAIPYYSAKLLWGKPGKIDHMVIAWHDPREMESIITTLKSGLDECRAPGAYYLSSSQFKIKKRKRIVSNFMTFGTVQALFCILVASIGVVNVMLANVVHRTREFAIRIAMGAQQMDVVLLVLVESFMLGLAGAVIGIGGAIVVAPPLCGLISSKIPEASQLIPHIGIKGTLIPLIVCSISGLIAGVIPAIRAGKLDILAVLRAE